MIGPDSVVVVRYGSHGTQLAAFVRETPNGQYVVRKWRSNSCSWTGDVYIARSQMLRLATQEESAKIGRDLEARARANARYRQVRP